MGSAAISLQYTIIINSNFGDYYVVQTISKIYAG